jgi:hypothetical protein
MVVGDRFQQYLWNTRHECGCYFAADELAFFSVTFCLTQNRKKVIDMKDALYNIMKIRYLTHGFEKPKKYLALMSARGEANELSTIY